LKLKNNEKVSILSDLLNPSSPFHNDFMPVYKSMTGSAEKQ
jgi:hypothetical protein